jgi:hypothetical protein
VFPIIHIGEASVRLDNTGYPPTIVFSFPGMNRPRTTMMTGDDVAFILIRVLKDEQTMMKYYILHQPYLLIASMILNIRLVPVVGGIYLNLNHVTSSFSLPLDHQGSSSSLHPHQHQSCQFSLSQSVPPL